MLLVSLVTIRGHQWPEPAYRHNGLGIVSYYLVKNINFGGFKKLYCYF